MVKIKTGAGLWEGGNAIAQNVDGVCRIWNITLGKEATFLLTPIPEGEPPPL